MKSILLLVIFFITLVGISSKKNSNKDFKIWITKNIKDCKRTSKKGDLILV